jgi:hypothetical protein
MKLRVSSRRKSDGTASSFAGLYDLDALSRVHGQPTWRKRQVHFAAASEPAAAAAAAAGKAYVLYSDASGRWAITQADRVARNRHFTVTEAHWGRPPHGLAWGIVEDDVWIATATAVEEAVGEAVGEAVEEAVEEDEVPNGSGIRG